MATKYTGHEAFFEWDADTEGELWGTHYGSFYSRHMLHCYPPALRNLADEVWRHIYATSRSVQIISLNWNPIRQGQEKGRFIHAFEESFHVRYLEKS